MATPERRAEYPGGPARNQKPRIRPTLISDDLFRDVLVKERKRADRSNQRLALVLVALDAPAAARSASVWQDIAHALAAVRRGTDVFGWFQKNEVLGLILPEVSPFSAFVRDLTERVHREVYRRLDADTAGRISIRLHMYPDSNAVEPERLWQRRKSKYDANKRTLDIVLSLILLAVFSPLLLIVAALVKLTSPGPVLFRQERVGHMMKPFIMLKFRSMEVNADHAIHHQFVSSFIKADGQTTNDSKSVLFKISQDSRITPIGRILRKTSLDELPQLWNVLRGNMSLVGPRPPLQYEVEQYEHWHKRRVLDAKPGLTGLWQVNGRSRTTFDEMVRLDLRYARTCSLWTDLKILLATPRAVISGKGAW